MQIIPFASLMNGCLRRSVRREGTKWPKTRKLDKHKCRRQEQTEREGHEKCNARQQELQASPHTPAKAKDRYLSHPSISP